MVSELVLGGLAVAGLLGLSAFFSGGEIAIFSLEAHRIETMAAGGGSGAGTLARLRDDPHRLLVTILVGNNVVNVAIATITTTLFVTRFPAGVGTALATLVVSVLVLLFGEIVPKSYGVANAEDVSRAVAGPIATLQVILWPVVAGFEAVSGAIRRLVGGARDIERPYVTRDELAGMVETAEETGAIDADERDIIQRVFRFDTTPVRQVMVPRADIVAVDADATVAEAIETCGAERVNRLPVYREGEDVVGYVDLRDLVDAPPDTSIRELLLPVVHAFEGREVDDVLAELQSERLEVAIVFDQFGAVEGLVTAEDIVEELVGEVFDVGELQKVVRVGPRRLSARGRAPVTTVNELLETDLPVVESGTVAALLSREFGRVPEVGESVTVAGVGFTVRSVSENRVLRVLVERLDG